jgi:hypothetical protein
MLKIVTGVWAQMSPIPPSPKYYLRKYEVITEKEKIWPQNFLPDVINNSGHVIICVRYLRVQAICFPRYCLLTRTYVVVCGINLFTEEWQTIKIVMQKRLFNNTLNKRGKIIGLHKMWKLLWKLQYFFIIIIIINHSVQAIHPYSAFMGVGPFSLFFRKR